MQSMCIVRSAPDCSNGSTRSASPTSCFGAGLRCDQQVPLKLVYQDVVIPCAYRADAIVENTVLIEIKAIDRLIPEGLKSFVR